MVKSGLKDDKRSHSYHFGITQELLYQLNDDKDLAALLRVGAGSGLAQALASNLQVGLRCGAAGPGSVSYHRTIFGRNVWPTPPSKPLWSLIWKNAKDPILVMLAIAAVVSTVLGTALPQQLKDNAWIEGVAIWATIFIVLGVGAGNDYHKEQQFRTLNSAQDVYNVTVIRDGTESVVVTSDLVVGDLVVLDTGNKVAADGVLTLSHGLVIDVACLTGESETIRKTEAQDPWLRRGTQVTEGSGRMLVLAVGVRSEWGRTMSLVGGSFEGQTPLQEKLTHLANLISKLGGIMFVLLLVGLMVRWMIVNRGFPGNKFSGTEEENGPVQFFLFCVTLLVVAIPEGLPLAVTIALAYSVRCMMRDRNFVRVLDACETMGAVTAICSDKTGTLTENRMSVVEGWFAGALHSVAPDVSDLPPELVTRLQHNIALNSKAFIIQGTASWARDREGRAAGKAAPLAAGGRGTGNAPRDDGAGTASRVELAGAGKAAKGTRWQGLPATTGQTAHAQGTCRAEYVGNRTECALLGLMADWGGSYQDVREQHKGSLPRVWGFSSERKMSSCLLHMGEDWYRLYTKGAAEWVLAECVAWQDSSQLQDQVQAAPMDSAKRQELSNLVQSMASRGLRCICLASRDLLLAPSELAGDGLEQPPPGGLVLQCIVGIKDPLRAEVPAAVAACQAAGVVVRMVTGDNLHTARFIAAECGILSEGGLALEGPTFRALTNEERVEVMPRLQVLARSSPEDKYILVKTLRSMRQVVAVTGDGTNDAPALKESDVGLAMGVTGTEVAKEAADIVILDDNFSSIVKAIVWGRTAFSNIRKVLQFQMTVNITAITVCFFYVLVKDQEPLNIIQLLWMNLVLNTMAASALATDRPNPEVLKHKPYGRHEPLITHTMWRYMAVNATYQIAWLFVLLFTLPAAFDRYHVSTKCELYVRECPALSVHLQLSAGSTGQYCYYLATGLGYTADGTADTSCDLQDKLDVVAVCAAAAPAQAPPTGSCPEAPLVQRLSSAVRTRYIAMHKDEIRRSLSVVFNAFIFMQIFNEINSRRINDEYDICASLAANPLFPAVFLATAGVQAVIVNFLDVIFKINPLIWQEWLATVAIGAGIVPLSLINRWAYRTFWLPKKLREEEAAATAAASLQAEQLGRYSCWSLTIPPAADLETGNTGPAQTMG